MAPKAPEHPRIGVPYRSTKEEREGRRDAYGRYIEAVKAAGGEPMEISLHWAAAERNERMRNMDGVLLTGSPADVDPGRYHAARNPHSADPDPQREETDFAFLEHAFAAGKAVLAICYGIQSLNVYLGGSLVQDIPTEIRGALEHDWEKDHGAPETLHEVDVEKNSRLAQLPGMMGADVQVNSSHHQSILDPGKGLRVVARAPDGVIEAVEWARDAQWVTGVQWHPERRQRQADAPSRALFETFVEAARAFRASKR